MHLWLVELTAKQDHAPKAESVPPPQPLPKEEPQPPEWLKWRRMSEAVLEELLKRVDQEGVVENESATLAEACWLLTQAHQEAMRQFGQPINADYLRTVELDITLRRAAPARLASVNCYAFSLRCHHVDGAVGARLGFFKSASLFSVIEIHPDKK